MCNIFVIWKRSADFESLYQIGRKFNLSKKEFTEILDHCKSRYDFVIFDQSGNPNPIRLNGYTPIEKYNDRF